MNSVSQSIYNSYSHLFRSLVGVFITTFKQRRRIASYRLGLKSYVTDYLHPVFRASPTDRVPEISTHLRLGTPFSLARAAEGFPDHIRSCRTSDEAHRPGMS